MGQIKGSRRVKLRKKKKKGTWGGSDSLFSPTTDALRESCATTLNALVSTAAQRASRAGWGERCAFTMGRI